MKASKLASDCAGTVIDCDAEVSVATSCDAPSSSTAFTNAVLDEADIDNKLNSWFLHKTAALAEQMADQVMVLGDGDDVVLEPTAAAASLACEEAHVEAMGMAGLGFDDDDR